MSYVVKKRKGLEREFGELPDDCIYVIFRFLPLRDLFNVLLLSKRYNEFYDHEIRWKGLLDIHFGSLIPVDKFSEEVNIVRSKELFKFIQIIFGFLPLKEIKVKKNFHSKEELYEFVKETFFYELKKDLHIKTFLYTMERVITFNSFTSEWISLRSRYNSGKRIEYMSDFIPTILPYLPTEIVFMYPLSSVYRLYSPRNVKNLPIECIMLKKISAGLFSFNQEFFMGKDYFPPFKMTAEEYNFNIRKVSSKEFVEYISLARAMYYHIINRNK